MNVPVPMRGNIDYKQQRRLILRCFPIRILSYQVAMCCKCQFWLCLFCWNLGGFQIDTDEVEEKLAVVHSWSICQPSICLSWLPALAVAGPRGVRAFKEGEKMKSNLQSASPKEVRVPAERRDFCAKTKIALILLLHLNAPTCPSVQSHYISFSNRSASSTICVASA